MQREQFLDLLTVAEVMLFIFGRLLMSGSASAPGAPGDLTCTPKCPAPGKKKRKPARCPRTGGAHSLKLYFTISLVGPGADHSLFLNPSPSLPPLSPFSFHSINFFFFNLIFFPLYCPPPPPPPPPSHPSPDSHIHLLSSQHILACYCFSLRFGRPVFTNGLLPADQSFRYSCTNYRRSKMESSGAE